MSNYKTSNASLLVDANGRPIGYFYNNQEVFFSTLAADGRGNLTGVNGPNGLLPVGAPFGTWANRPAPLLNATYFATDIGGGNLFIANGTRWKPVNGNCILDAIDTANAGPANTTETQVNPTHNLLPAAILAGFDRLRVFLSLSKSGTVDTCTLRLRYGPLGTVADPVIATLSLATTNQSLGTMLEFKRTAATAVQKQGNGDPNGNYNGVSTVAYPAAVTVSNLDSTDMYMSLTTQMTAGTETPTLQDYTLELFATDS